MDVHNPKTFQTNHGDLVHDLAFDFYGKRMATCGSDHMVKVWDLTASGEWAETAQIKVHNSSVWKVSWAHPEFGQIVASCSSDHSVVIHQEKSDISSQQQNHQSGAWLAFKKNESRASVRAVEFAPKHHGLMLASCSEDGKVRIYEAQDPLQLSQFHLNGVIQLGAKNSPKCTSLSWNPSKSSSLCLAVGCKAGTASTSADSGSNIHLIEEQDNGSFVALASSGLIDVKEEVSDIAFAPDLGRSYHLLAAACSNFLRIWRISTNPSGESKYIAQRELNYEHTDEVWRVCWNITGTTIAATGSDGKVMLWQVGFDGKWEHLSEEIMETT